MELKFLKVLRMQSNSILKIIKRFDWMIFVTKWLQFVLRSKKSTREEFPEDTVSIGPRALRPEGRYSMRRE